MNFQIDDIDVDLKYENDSLRLTTGSRSYLLHQQTFEETREIVTYNFEIVRSHYQKISQEKISLSDLNQVSLKIVMTYFYMYNLWRSMYKKERERDLKWLKKDFASPSTSDVIISYFKEKYPSDYEGKCQILLGMDAEKFKAYEKRRDDFFNK